MLFNDPEELDLLVVDGDGSQYERLVRAIEEAGHRLELAGDGYRALKLATTRPARVWLANLALPDTSGLELLKTVRANRPAIPFYLLSDQYSVADELNARAAGATGYLSKPVDQSWIELCLAALSRRTVRAGPRPNALKNPCTKPLTRTQSKPLPS